MPRTSSRAKRLLGLTVAFLLLGCGSSVLLSGAWSEESSVDATSPILYESNRDNNEISELDSVLPSGADPRVLLSVRDGGLDAPVYSPDRHRIAYARYLHNGNFEIFVMRANGKRQRQVTHSVEEHELNGAPSFSPDGSRIAYQSNRGTGTTQNHIFLVGSHGGRSRQLTRGNGDDRAPSFSPDGRRIVFSRDQGGYESICVVGVKGGRVRTLARIANSSADTDGDPAFSPDGSQIVFQGIEREQILIVNADGTGLRELAEGYAPDFSPSGSQIVFVGGEGDTYGLYTMNGDGTDKKLIVPVVAGSETELNSPSW